MLRGFGTATNATLKELLASDTDGAEDPGDGDDVDARVPAGRAAACCACACTCIIYYHVLVPGRYS